MKILSVGSDHFPQDTQHVNPIVRAMAIRTFSSLAGASKETLNEYMDTLKKALDVLRKLLFSDPDIS